MSPNKQTTIELNEKRNSEIITMHLKENKDRDLGKNSSKEVPGKADISVRVEANTDTGKIQESLLTFASIKEKLGKFIESLMSDSKDSISTLASTLNQITGYSRIEQHKESVQQLEIEVKNARLAVKAAKKQYSDAIEKRSALQREVNELLTRKNNWNPSDVERFTELYKSDHENHRNEVESKNQLEIAEQIFDSTQMKLGSKILTRYHEEQLWSDKIRQALTWGTWMLTGVNILLFAVATFFVEPWKRKRLVNAFNHEVQERFDEYSKQIEGLNAKIVFLNENKDGKTSLRVLDGSPQQTYTIERFNILESVKTSLNRLIYALNTSDGTILIRKFDLAIFSSIAIGVSCGFASLLTYVFLR